MTTNEFDAIVIGAGLSGLTAASSLSAAGIRVCCIEQHSRVGGYATNFIRKGYTFDVSMHNIGPLFEHSELGNVLDELGVLSKLEYCPFNEFQRIIFPDHDITIFGGRDRFTHKLQELFPREREGIRTLFSKMRKIAHESLEIDTLKMSFESLIHEYPLLPVKFPLLSTLVDTSLKTLMDLHIRDPKLQSIIAASWWIYGLPPSDLAAILFSIPTIRYYDTGGGVFKGGGQKVSDTLAEMIRNNRGVLLTSTKVSGIITAGEKVQGVIAARGEKFKAPVVISGINPFDTIVSMMSDTQIPRSYKKSVEKLQPSLSALQLYLGLDIDPYEIGMENHSIVLYETYNHERCYRNICEGGTSESFYYINRSFEGTYKKPTLSALTLDHLINWESLTPVEYKCKKRLTIDRLLKRIERLMPDIRRHIVVTELATPLTMQRYTGNIQGAIYGYDYTIDQSGINRLTYETPVKGLYLVGAYTYPGAGYASVISSAYRTAKSILKSHFT